LFLSDGQYAVQDLVNRKVTSSYYTSKDGVAVVRVFVKSIGRGDGVVVMDPSLGSGVLLPSNSNLIRPGKVVGIETNEEPCDLARRILTKLYTNVEVVCGDAFRVAWGYRPDIIISNPPFVRWSLLDREYRRGLLGLMGRLGCAEFISRGDPGLHILSFFLMDCILRAGGYMIFVMSASTFCAGQGSGLKRHLRVRYYVLGMVENGLYPSFSVGGGFKELVLFLKKRDAVGETGLNEGTVIYRWDEKLKSIGSVKRTPRIRRQGLAIPIQYIH
jgi:hypothetical protein